MDIRFGRKILLLALAAAAPGAARAANPSGPVYSETGSYYATPAEKVAEAKRLADQAAILAERAAQLAAESNAAGGAKIIHQTTPWTNRDAAEVLISDAEPQALPPVSTSVAPLAAGTAEATTPSFGWRSHSAVPPSAIRFSDPSVPSTSNVAINNALATTSTTAQPTKTVGEGFELKLAEPAASKSASTDGDGRIILQVLPTVPTREAASLPTSLSDVPQSSNQESFHLAANTIADGKVRTAESQEPMPGPDSSFSAGRPLGTGIGESYDCLDGCCPPPRPLFWVSGIEATFLAPDLNSGWAGFAVEEFNNDRFSYFSTDTDDIDDLYVAPRLWLGVQGCLWGVNARYWHMRASEGSFDPTLGSDGTWDGPKCGQPDFGFNSCNDFEAYTIDLEVTRRVCLHDCWMQFALGVRHAEIEHNAALSAAAIADDSVLFGFANAHRQSRGTGILLGWYGRKPIYPCSCVNWFYNFRWSALWGPTETAADTGALVTLTSTDPDAVAAAGSVNGASTVANDTLFIGEIQVGLEWDYALRCLPANAFCRLAVEYQRWSSGTGYSQANSFAGTGIDNNGSITQATLGDAFAIADAPELDLVGLAVSTGLTW